jgi:hypothetical protein
MHVNAGDLRGLDGSGDVSSFEGQHAAGHQAISSHAAAIAASVL